VLLDVNLYLFKQMNKKEVEYY